LGIVDKTLLKGLMVLEAVAQQAGDSITIQALADQVGLTKSNTHRTLQTLAHAGYAVRDEATGNYRSTLKLFELGANSWPISTFAASHRRICASWQTRHRKRCTCRFSTVTAWSM
jgi:IclR family KDG regulon transcriptional repressor